MLVNEVGPFMMFTKLRSLTGIKHDDNGEPIAWPVGNVLSCLFCTSVWASAILLHVPGIKPVANILAVSGLVVLVSKNGKS